MERELGWMVDPSSNSFPELSVYQFGNNSPVSGIDLDGVMSQNVR